MRHLYTPPYRATLKQRKLEREETEQVCETGMAEPAVAERASSIRFVPKKDSSLRFCDDYRRFNAATERESYPIPRMDAFIDLLGEAKMLLTLDASSGCWWIKVIEKGVDDTAFVTHHGLVKYTRMPFGFKNALETFQRAMGVIKASVK